MPQSQKVSALNDRQLASDPVRLQRLSELHAACVQARNGLRLIKERNRRSLAAAETAYKEAADALALAITDEGVQS